MHLSRELLDQLRTVLSPERVLTDAAVTASYATEWTGRFAGVAEVVVMPRSTTEVAAVMQVCSRAAAPVVPQGGRTGLVGGGVPMAGSVVLDLRGLDHLAIDDDSFTATAGAGVTIAALDAAARRVGRRYAVGLASRDSATVGGTIATNAGGVRAMRLGDTRAQVLGVEAVLADGTVVSAMPEVVRSNTGYHLPSLLCGSEGTLAVITSARLRLLPARRSRTVALLAFAAVPDAARAAQVLRDEVFVEAVELMLSDGVDLVCTVATLPAPMHGRHRCYLLVEAAAPSQTADGLLEAVAALPDVQDAAVGTDSTAIARLWSYRDRHTEAIATLGPVHKLDVTLPAAAVAEFIDAVEKRVTAAYPQAQVWRFGHVADGNVHVNVTGVDPADDSVDDLVLRLVAGYGGSISTEHGIGRASFPWLSLAKSPAEMRVLSAIKAALDPAGLLNPGVLLP